MDAKVLVPSVTSLTQLPQHLSWIFQRSKVTCILNFKKHSTMSFSHKQAYMIEVCYPCFNKACFQQRVEIDKNKMLSNPFRN